jgi:hypothetical protein
MLESTVGTASLASALCCCRGLNHKRSSLVDLLELQLEASRRK